MLAARRLLMTLATGAVACMPSAVLATFPAAAAGPAAASAPMATRAVAAPSDSVRVSQGWVFDALRLPAAWSISKGKGVTVAVLDSGVDPSVNDLSGAVIGQRDLTLLRTPDSNAHWGEHGTWMASIIDGRGHGFDSTDGIMGVAPEANILSIRVIPDKDDPGYKTYEAEPEQAIQDSLAKGIKYAVQQHAAVISMSIGYSAPSAAVRSALQDAYSRGVVPPAFVLA